MLSSSRFNYALHFGGENRLITIRIDRKTWYNYQGRQDMLRGDLGVINNLQRWCWNSNSNPKWTVTRLRILCHPQLRQYLRPFDQEPHAERLSASKAYKPWLLLVESAFIYGQQHCFDLLQPICELIEWHITEGPNASHFTELDREVLRRIILAARDPSQFMERNNNEPPIPIDEKSIEQGREQAYNSKDDKDVSNILGATIQYFLSRDVAKFAEKVSG